MYNICSYTTHCPFCNSSLHYSRCFSEVVCNECMWVNGEYAQRYPTFMTLDEYIMLASILYKQIRNKQISYDEYSRIFDIDIELT